MGKASTVLIQKPGSPFQELVAQVLDQRRLTLHAGPPPQPLPGEPPPLVLWDTSRFSGPELEQTASLLAPERVGVLVLCPELDRDRRRALTRCRALGLAYRPFQPQALAALWALARDLHRRRLALQDEYLALQRELAERRLIDRAKLVVMAASGCSESQALRRLQRYSRRHNRRLPEVAQGIIGGYEVWEDLEET